MIDDRNKPLWPWIVALLIGLPVLYVASFGPACWLADRGVVPDRVVDSVYEPLALVVARYCADSICNAVIAYGDWGCKKQNRAAVMILIEKVRFMIEPDKSRVTASFY